MKRSKIPEEEKLCYDTIRDHVLKKKLEIHETSTKKLLKELETNKASQECMINALKKLDGLGVRRVEADHYNNSVTISPKSFRKLIKAGMPASHDYSSIKSQEHGITIKSRAIPSLIEELERRNSFKFKHSRNPVNNLKDFQEQLNSKSGKVIRHHAKKNHFSSWARFFNPCLAKDLEFFEKKDLKGEEIREVITQKIKAHEPIQIPEWF